MSFNDYNQDAELGRKQQPTTIHSQRFLLFRDVAFVTIILFHIASTIIAISSLVTHMSPRSTYGYLGVAIFTGTLSPILAIIGWRDHLPISKWTSKLSFELGWVMTVMLIDFIIAVGHSSVRGANKSLIAILFLETISIILYALALGGMILLQHRRFPEVAVWDHSIQSVQWLESAQPAERGNPTTPPATSGGGKIAPWQIYEEMQDVKLDEKRAFASPASPNNTYVGAHPIWQMHVDRQAGIEDDMAYIVQRYGLDANTAQLKTNTSNPSKHAKKSSIRGLEISRPMPAVTNVRRAHTIATKVSGQTGRPTHGRTSSLGTYDHLYRGEPKPSLHLQVPTLDVPIDVESGMYPDGSPQVSQRMIGNRSLGLASRTLVGTSRPKAKATRAYVDTSKPLPSPPALQSDESLVSSDPSGQHSFVMAMAHRVKAVPALMVTTPRASEMRIDQDDENDGFSDLD
jgi:hypothetical protein